MQISVRHYFRQPRVRSIAFGVACTVIGAIGLKAISFGAHWWLGPSSPKVRERDRAELAREIKDALQRDELIDEISSTFRQLLAQQEYTDSESQDQVIDDLARHLAREVYPGLNTIYHAQQASHVELLKVRQEYVQNMVRYQAIAWKSYMLADELRQLYLSNLEDDSVGGNALSFVKAPLHMFGNLVTLDFSGKPEREEIEAELSAEFEVIRQELEKYQQVPEDPHPI